MNVTKTKSLENIEEKMQNLEEGSLRFHVLEAAKNFKMSWVALGRVLYSVWKEKSYKEWGYAMFDSYTSKEIGIRKNTAMKLLRSYYFLEKEEPEYLKEEYVNTAEPAQVPSYEAIDMLRLAKNKKTLDRADYADLKNDIFQKGKDVRDVRKSLTALIRDRKELAPEEAWENKRKATVKRFIGTLKSLKQELELSKLLPAALIKEAANLIKKIEAEINEQR